MMQLARRLLVRYSHLNWALADQAMVSGVNFLTGIMLARYLGLEEFGRFTLAWMAVLFVSSLQHAAINSPMMSIGPKQAESERPAYYGAVLAQHLAFAGFSFALLLVGAGLAGLMFPEWSVGPLVLPLAGAGFAYVMQDFLRRYFFTRNRPAAAFANDAVSYLGQLGLLIVLFQIVPMDSARALWVIAATSALAVLVGAFGIGHVVWNAAVLRTVALRHWRSAKWLSASALMSWTTGHLFKIGAGALLGVSAVGALKAAQNLIGVTHIFFLGLENIVPARAARRFAEGGAKVLTAYLGRVALGGGFATAVVAVVLAAAPGFWLGFVFGDEYSGYGYLLRWYAVIYLGLFLILPLNAGLRAIEFTRPLFLASLAGTLFTLASVYPLIHWLGLTGVMGGLLINRVIQTVILTSSFGRRLKVLQPMGTDDEPRPPKTDRAAVDVNI